MRKTLNVLVALALGLASFAAAQTPPAPPGQAGIDELKKTAVKVFLDCDFCDTEYIKTEITFVNYVRDRLEAQVHILITTQATGGGGVEYTITFIGQGDCKDAKDLQKYYSSKTDTDDDVRRGLVKALKLGLMSFVARTPIAGRIAVDYAPPERPAAGRDRWNYWLFSISGDGRFSGEESYLDRMADVSFSANRVTPASKVRLGLSADRSYAEIRGRRGHDHRDVRELDRVRPLRSEPRRALVGRGQCPGRILALQQHRPGPERRPGRRVQFLSLFPVHPPAAPGPLHAVGGTRQVPGRDDLRQDPGDAFPAGAVADPRPPREVRHGQPERRGRRTISTTSASTTSTCSASSTSGSTKASASTASGATPGSTTSSRSSPASRPTRRCSCASTSCP